MCCVEVMFMHNCSYVGYIALSVACFKLFPCIDPLVALHSFALVSSRIIIGSNFRSSQYFYYSVYVAWSYASLIPSPQSVYEARTMTRFTVVAKAHLYYGSPCQSVTDK